MLKVLRIIFTIICALCLAAAIPLGMFFDYIGVICALAGAAVFFGLMYLCKYLQDRKNPPPPPTDFFNPSQEEDKE